MTHTSISSPRPPGRPPGGSPLVKPHQDAAETSDTSTAHHQHRSPPSSDETWPVAWVRSSSPRGDDAARRLAKARPRPVTSLRVGRKMASTCSRVAPVGPYPGLASRAVDFTLSRAFLTVINFAPA